MVKLTKPQRLALEILAEADEPVRAGKRTSLRAGEQGHLHRGPYVNMIAVHTLAKNGLARTLWPRFATSVFSHDNKYTITEAGRAALEDE